MDTFTNFRNVTNDNGTVIYITCNLGMSVMYYFDWQCSVFETTAGSGAHKWEKNASIGGSMLMLSW